MKTIRMIVMRSSLVLLSHSPRISIRLIVQCSIDHFIVNAQNQFKTCRKTHTHTHIHCPLRTRNKKKITICGTKKQQQQRQRRMEQREWMRGQKKSAWTSTYNRLKMVKHQKKINLKRREMQCACTKMQFKAHKQGRNRINYHMENCRKWALSLGPGNFHAHIHTN